MLIEYLHDNRVCHRDIKLENILMAEKRKTSLVKITDFGLSKLLDDNTLMVSYVGTPSYIAPEVLKNGMCVAAASGGQSSYVASRGMFSKSWTFYKDELIYRYLINANILFLCK